MKKGITLIEMPFYLVAVFILATIGAMFIGCSDTGVSADDYTNKRCDYTVHYYHPNADEIIRKSGSFNELYTNDDYSTWSLKDLYTRVITNDTIVYKDTLLTDVELKELLNDSDLVPTDDDEMYGILDETNVVNYLLKELVKRKGELLNVNCYEAKYVTGVNNE